MVLDYSRSITSPVCKSYFGGKIVNLFSQLCLGRVARTKRDSTPKKKGASHDVPYDYPNLKYLLGSTFLAVSITQCSLVLSIKLSFYQAFSACSIPAKVVVVEDCVSSLSLVGKEHMHRHGGLEL